MTIDFRPEDPAFHVDPFPLLRRMQDEDPLHWSPRMKAWVLTRYDDVRWASADAQAMSSDRLRPYFATLPAAESGRMASLIRYLSLWMVFRDPPDHTRLRRLSSKVMNPASAQAMQPVVERITAGLLDALEGREEIDFVGEFAGPLPALVIMAMLGVPDEALARVKALSDEMALFIGSSRMDAGKYAIAERATAEMAGFFRDLIAERRARPKHDMISSLVALRDGEDTLTEDELVATCILMLFAGHETTTNHLANGMLALLGFPDQLARMRDDPLAAPRAVEELLRYDGPSGAQVRVATGETALHGRRIAAGDRVVLMLNAANRDPRAYAEPDRVDIDRDGPPHLAFGWGIHLCLGFPLARLEGRVVLPMVLRRWPQVALARPAGDWLNSLVFRGMRSLWLSPRGRARTAAA